VYARGNRKARLFLDDVDREGYLWLLGQVIVRQGWRCLSYCLMNNHVHLLIETPEPNLGRGIQIVHGDFGRNFNRRHDGSGHVFQRPYGSNRMTNDEHLWTAAAYIAANPVEAGICARPEEWPWSSYGATSAGLRRPAWLDSERLLERFSVLGGDPLARYAETVTGRCA
jgi:REP element-mobilizing transposase RayT